MFGRDWESAEATIVATQVAVQTRAGYEDRLEYVVDVHLATGSAFRVTLQEPKFIKGEGGFSQPAVGAVVGGCSTPRARRPSSILRIRGFWVAPKDKRIKPRSKLRLQQVQALQRRRGRSLIRCRY
jgi:hypothetical protein